MPGPQSTLFFVLLMIAFGALMFWLVVARHVVFRVLAACLAFVPAVMFGVAAVNKYYDYYQTWNSAISDIGGTGVQAIAISGKQAASSGGISQVLNNPVYTQLAAQQGTEITVQVPGKLSGITRTVYVYLPPQYFQRAYRNYQFPAIELIHGYPGAPQDWISVMGVTTIYSQLLSAGQAKPAILVMPDANGGARTSLQCLNQAGGAQDATYLAHDLPAYLTKVLRIWPGRSWGIAGYSEGGYCAANMGVQYGSTFAAAGVMSGYFVPMKNQLAGRLVSPFSNKLEATVNTPGKELLRLPPSAQVSQFWIGAGQKSLGDVRDAQLFRQLVSLRQPWATLQIVSGGHTMYTWRQLVGPMLGWMTQQLTTSVQQAEARAKKAAQPPASPAPTGKNTLPAPGATPFPTKPGKSPSPRPSKA